MQDCKHLKMASELIKSRFREWHILKIHLSSLFWQCHLKKKLFIWLHQVLVLAHVILSCCIWDLVPWKWKVKVTQLCLTLCNPMDYTVHRILQARILEWVAIPFSRGSSQPRDQTQFSLSRDQIWAPWISATVLSGKSPMVLASCLVKSWS